jgi:hypothetical protein
MMMQQMVVVGLLPEAHRHPQKDWAGEGGHLCLGPSLLGLSLRDPSISSPNTREEPSKWKSLSSLRRGRVGGFRDDSSL